MSIMDHVWVREYLLLEGEILYGGFAWGGGGGGGIKSNND